MGEGGYQQINKSLNVGAFDDYLNMQQSLLPKLVDVTQFTPRVLPVLATFDLRGGTAVATIAQFGSAGVSCCGHPSSQIRQDSIFRRLLLAGSPRPRGALGEGVVESKYH
ncbi:hypothetical protein BDV28DRAFT_146332 [Aspergillus coremiiformis]|uniref:Uncharacterized protein n=1 Tax=Aspergillus coremiiformis TaxID=138285 RepID=A0A5N6ZCR4_9EURO|nr:hypothetical protein BDV28DRAFT_146332 [Aspergillus coremiiformis]